MSWNIPPFVLLRQLPVDCTLVRTSSSTSWFSLSTLVTSASSFSLQLNSCIAVSFEARQFRIIWPGLFCFCDLLFTLVLICGCFPFACIFWLCLFCVFAFYGNRFSFSLAFFFPFSASLPFFFGFGFAFCTGCFVISQSSFLWSCKVFFVGFLCLGWSRRVLSFACFSHAANSATFLFISFSVPMYGLRIRVMPTMFTDVQRKQSWTKTCTYANFVTGFYYTRGLWRDKHTRIVDFMDLILWEPIRVSCPWEEL